MAKTEPISLFDLVKDGLKFVGRSTFLHRYIYIGNHTFDHHNMSIHEIFENVINRVNEDETCDEPLTGLLLYYSKYFIHVIDGSDESLTKHLRILLAEYNEYIGNLKFLVTYHHINQRFYSVWVGRTAKPPTLLEEINPECNLKETMHYAEMCLLKVYSLALRLRKYETEDNAVNITVSEITDDMFEFLPEYTLLDFLLQSPHMQDVRKYLAKYDDILTVVDYNEVVWPIHSDYIPYDVFDKPVDPVPELPKKN